VRLVGIDLGGTSIKAGAIDPAGKVLATRSVPTGLEDGAEAVFERMAQLARELGAETRVGIGAPGLIDHARGIVLDSPNLAQIEGQPLCEAIARRLGFERDAVLLENDANAAAVAEAWLGAGRGRRDLLMVTLGTGVGGGLVLGGRLFAGSGGMAGEIGHVVIDPDGPPCGCGRRGCMEQFASATAARRRALERGLPREAPGDLVRLADAARRRDGAERALCFEIGRDLGRGLAVAVTLLDLRLFVVGGGFGAALDTLQAGVRVGLRERSWGARLDDVRVLPAELGSDAGWIGAARLFDV
jgi:glucokinase